MEERLGVLDDNKDESLEQFVAWTNAYFPIALKAEEISGLDLEARHEKILSNIREAYTSRESLEEKEALVGLERFVVIRSLDRRWQDHLTEMEDLRRAVNLRGFGQKDALNVYKSEAYRFFEELMSNVRTEICQTIFRSQRHKSFRGMLSRMSSQVNVAPAPGSRNRSHGRLLNRLASETPLAANPLNCQRWNHSTGASRLAAMIP